MATNRRRKFTIFPPSSMSSLITRIPSIDPWQMDIVDSYSRVISGINVGLSNHLESIIPSLLSTIQLNLTSNLLGTHKVFESALTSILSPFPFTNPRVRVAEELGWVVHHTLPTSLLNETSEEDLDAAILTFYKDEWQDVRKELEIDIQGYLISEDSKETMKQALQGHEAGLYRLVPRAMLPEIEAVARDQMNENVSDKINMREQIDSFSEFPISWMRDLTSGMSGYRAVEYLYKRISSEAERGEVAANPIPNRHAVAHGLVPYATEKTSLNSIFLADFVFYMITELKKNMIKKAAGILKTNMLSKPESTEGHRWTA